MTQNRASILGQARAEGYRNGVGQMSQVAFDEAYERGKWEEHYEWQRRAFRLRLLWLTYGLVVGFVVGEVLP